MSVQPLSGNWAMPFRASAFRLRFELGGEVFGVEAPIARFAQAFDRARLVARDALLASQQVLAIAGCWPDPARDLFAPANDGFVALKAAGFTADPIGQWESADPLSGVDDEESTLAAWRAFNLTARMAERDVLLWCAISCEMAVAPKAPIVSFLADLEQGILIHVYDDRGMDVIALDRDTLAGIYRTHNAWLLDYDRPRIIEAFGPAR